MSKEKNILDFVYANEKKHAEKIWFTQPVGGGKVEEYTWTEAMAQVRSIAAYLKGLGLEPGSKIAMVSKNCAHSMMSELAIWMAGHVTVSIYPTVNKFG